MAAGFLIRGSHAKGGFTVGGGGEDALDKTLHIAYGVNESRFAVLHILGLSPIGSGDDGQANDAGFLDAIR